MLLVIAPIWPIFQVGKACLATPRKHTARLWGTAETVHSRLLLLPAWQNTVDI